MEKAGTNKNQKKPNKKEQYERFQKTARELAVDDEKSALKFERDFAKIVPPKRGKAHS